MHYSIKTIRSYSGFHVVDLDPEGFIVTPDDDEIEPVIAFSDRGSFDPRSDNPLWIMLNRDIQARAKHLRRLKPTKNSHRATSAQKRLAGSDDPDAAHQRWQRWRERGKMIRTGEQASVAGTPVSATTVPPPPGGYTPPVPQTSIMSTDRASVAPRIDYLSFQNGHVSLRHDALESVRILVSYDAGRNWQTLDVGCFMPEWTSKTPVRENDGWFKLEPDGLYDAMTVAFMRHPPVVSDRTDESFLRTFVDASDDSPTVPADQSSGVSDVRVSPLTQSQWNQKTAQGYACYNYYCPPGPDGNANNYYAGCVATAMGQVMRFWQYPGSAYSHSYIYGQMPLAPSSASYNLSQWQNVGRLLRDCGTSVNMSYGSGGSSADMLLVDSAMKNNFSYAGAVDIYTTGGISAAQRDLILRSNLAGGYPVLMGIRNSGGSGHAVVADGFGYSSGTLYYHVNMGWGGTDDAWYNLPTVDDGYYNFTIVDAFVFNVYPSGTGELIAGRVLSPGGTPIQNVTVTASRSGQDYAVTTDSKGYYAVRVPSGQAYSIAASKAGYASVTLPSIAVGTSQDVNHYYSGGQWGVCSNYFGADFMLSSFSISAVPLTNNVWLRWSTPTNCGLPNNTVYIRWSTATYPVTSNDGDLVYSGTETFFEHTALDGSGTVTNYYTIWGDNGSSYVDLGANSHASAVPAPGQMKFFWLHSTSQLVADWILNANGTRKSLGYVSASPAGAGWDIKAAGDIDRDGTVDLVWYNTSTTYVAYWLLNPDGTRRSLGYVSASPAGAGWDIKAAGDIDRDGTVDLVWYNTSTTYVAYWLLNPDGTRRSLGYVSASPAGAGWNIKAAGN
jgi:hypothetical protein